MLVNIGKNYFYLKINRAKFPYGMCKNWVRELYNIQYWGKIILEPYTYIV
jgi:hypothetical protein